MQKLGQVFTPKHIVDRILDELEFSNNNLLDKKIMEPSFGNGAFLKVIVKRIISYCFEKGINNEEIEKQLLNIYGIEIDKSLYKETIHELDLITDKYGLNRVNWNLFNQDSTTFETNIKFDFVVGNPPYIRIHDLEEKMRNQLKKFKFSNGMMDIYITFFEIGIDLLKKDGKLGFITPNSFLKNTSQKVFRDYLCDAGILHKIINYNFAKVFDADTYTAITILHKEKADKTFYYSESDGVNDLFVSKIDLSNYKDKEKWAFGNNEDNLFLEQNSDLKKKLQDICNIQYGASTNRDDVYIGKYEPKTKTTGMFNGFEVERAILRQAVKGSAYDGKSTHMILFPYVLNKQKNTYEPIKETVLKKKYPLAYKYLLHHKTSLEERDMDKNATTWYQFARSQGLAQMNNQKILVKHIFSLEQKNIKVYKIPKNSIIYAGIFINPKDMKDEKEIIKILNSESFCKYCKLVGKDMSGGYKYISTKNIKSYGIE